jgi:hypothetical protein
MFLFFIGLVVLLILYFSQTSDLINPNDCVATYGTYAAIPSQTGTTLSDCVQPDGTTGGCTFPAATLQAAITACDANREVCSSFAYDGTNVTFVTTPFIAADPSINLYRFQS